VLALAFFCGTTHQAGAARFGPRVPTKQLCGADYACPVGHYAMDGSMQCQKGPCKDSDCCAASPTCGMSFACPTGTHAKPDTTFCSNATCSTSDCCQPNQTCGESRTVACLGTQRMLPPETVCANATCVSSDCCLTTDPDLPAIYICGLTFSLPCPEGTTMNTDAECFDRDCTPEDCCFA
jgi:hypothetical protein